VKVAVTLLSVPDLACANLQTHLDAWDAALQQANPGDSFASQAASLNGVACPAGVCPGCTGLRRLLESDGTGRLEVRTKLARADFVVPGVYGATVQKLQDCDAQNIESCDATNAADAAGGQGGEGNAAVKHEAAIGGAVAGVAATAGVVAVLLWRRRRTSEGAPTQEPKSIAELAFMEPVKESGRV
jgi:hypothetical protein